MGEDLKIDLVVVDGPNLCNSVFGPWLDPATPGFATAVTVEPIVGPQCTDLEKRCVIDDEEDEDG